MGFVHTEPPPPWADGEEWWACSEPERRSDNSAIYHAWCPWCMVKLKLDMTLDETVVDGVRQYLVEGGVLQDESVLHVLARLEAG